MNIIHFTHELPQASGVATFVREVSAALEDIGIESRIVLDPKELPREPEAGTILHIHGIWKPVYRQAAKWAKANGVKIVWSTHGMTAPWSMAHKRWKKLIAWWLYQKRDLQSAALIHSTVEKEAEWNRALGLGAKGIVVPLGTHLPEGEILTQRRRGAERTLLFVGRVYPVKALDRLIEAFIRADISRVERGECVDACGAREEWRLRIVGPDQAGHQAELEKIISTRSTSSTRPKIEFVGSKFGAELDAEYANCDILALVSHTENFGATVVDAMAHGKPVITSTATPWREVVGSAGWWVDNDVETLTDCLRVALTTPSEVLRAMGAKGRKLVEAKYTWRAVASRLSTAYAEIVGQVAPIGAKHE